MPRFVLLLLLLWPVIPVALGVVSGPLGSAAFAKGGDEGGDEGGDDSGGDDGSSGHGGDDGGGHGSDEGGRGESSGSGSGSGSDSGSDEGGGNSGEASSGSSGSSGRGGRERAEVGGLDPGVQVFRRDGQREILGADSYARIDARGRVVEQRPSTPRDRKAMAALRDDLPARARKAGGAIAIVDRQRIEIVDARGWVEVLEADRYVLRDPNGNTVTRRAATPADRARIRDLLSVRAP